MDYELSITWTRPRGYAVNASAELHTSGALASIASSAFTGGGNYTYNEDGSIASSSSVFGGAGKFAKNIGGTLAFGTVAGGAGARLTGGNFWQGAVTGLVVSGLNHAVHNDDEEPKPKPKPKGAKALNLEQANKFYNRTNGKVSDIYNVDASTVDLNFVNTTGWIIDNLYNVQTLYLSENGLVFGKLNLIYKGNNQVQILNDVYDFNLEFSNPMKFTEFISPRNLFTAIGQINAGYGTSFTFKFNGLNTIPPPRVFNFERGPKY